MINPNFAAVSMPPASPLTPWQRFVDVACVLFVIALAGVQYIPAENEPHYLALARHYWQPDWCAGDLLLQSAPIHRAFYLLFGWVAALCSLDTSAWIGRLAAWWLLAMAWQRLSFSVVGRPGWAGVSAASLALGNQYGHLSGEWLIGGIEAKTLAYPLVFAALAAWGEDNARWSIVSLGAAAALHPLVGGWALLTWLAAALIGERRSLRTLRTGRGAIAVALAAALCMVGMLPPILADLHTPSEARATAWQILVQQRIPHHLLPWTFGWRAWLGFGAMVALSIVMNRLLQSGPRSANMRADSDAPQMALRRVVRFTAVAVGLAAVGLMLAVATRSAPRLQAEAMRFYWFRQVGVIVPACGALLATAWLRPRFETHRWRRSALAALLFGAVLALNPGLGEVPLAERSTPRERLYHWKDVCIWINKSTPPEAVFITPRLRQTFKWYAQRAEVATWKDVPQDAAHLVVWWRRLLDLHTVQTPHGREWIRSLTQHSPEKLRALGERYGAEYLVCGSEPALDLPCLYRLDHYAVYRLAKSHGDEAQTP